MCLTGTGPTSNGGQIGARGSSTSNPFPGTPLSKQQDGPYRTTPDGSHYIITTDQSRGYSTEQGSNSNETIINQPVQWYSHQYIPVAGWGETNEAPADPDYSGVPVPGDGTEYDKPVVPGVPGNAPTRPAGDGTGGQPVTAPTPIYSTISSGNRRTSTSGPQSKSRSLLQFLDEEELRRLGRAK